MQILVQSGSSVEYVHFRPSYQIRGDDDVVETDKNGHSWPYYSYRRGKVSSDTPNDRGFVSTVAVPVSLDMDPMVEDWFNSTD